MSTPSATPANLPATTGSGQLAPVIEGPGRYAVYQAGDGGWAIARATGLCETCLGCGCGEQAELIEVPFLVVSMASQAGKNNLLGTLKSLRGRRG